jgi:hypothetical protein
VPSAHAGDPSDIRAARVHLIRAISAWCVGVSWDAWCSDVARDAAVPRVSEVLVGGGAA